MAIALAMIAWLGYVWSPIPDEAAHLAAGCLVAEFGKTDLYTVNPPLVKGIAGAVAALQDPVYDWRSYQTSGQLRNEWDVGEAFFAANGHRFFWLVTTARWSLLSFWLIGSLTVWKWSCEIGGREAGWLALVFWCFSPEVMTWTATLCADSPAASVAVLAVWSFRKWLQDLTWQLTAITGGAIGVGLLTKTSLVILLPMIVVLTLCHKRVWRIRACGQLIFIAILAVLVLNVGYGFDGSFEPLGTYNFRSWLFAASVDLVTGIQRLPAGVVEVAEAAESQSTSMIANFPVPFPRSFVTGLDLQRLDFERGGWSYLSGHHSPRGWWYWYAVAFVLKTPLALLLGIVTAIGTVVFQRACSSGVWRLPGGETITALNRRNISEGLILIGPTLTIFALVSSQSGFTCYLRYILPAYPFLVIWVSVQLGTTHIRFLRWARWGLAAWFVADSASVFPHSLSYINVLGGGPEHGADQLIGASLDYGQDMRFLAEWLDEHPEIDHVSLSVFGATGNSLPDVNFSPPPFDPRSTEHRGLKTSETAGPLPGWYVVSVTQLKSRFGEFNYLNDFQPVDTVGFSIRVFQLNDDDVNAWLLQNGRLNPDASK